MLKNVRGETPLDLASQFGHVDTVSDHSIATLYMYSTLVWTKCHFQLPFPAVNAISSCKGHCLGQANLEVSFVQGSTDATNYQIGQESVHCSGRKVFHYYSIIYSNRFMFLFHIVLNCLHSHDKRYHLYILQLVMVTLLLYCH